RLIRRTLGSSARLLAMSRFGFRSVKPRVLYRRLFRTPAGRRLLVAQNSKRFGISHRTFEIVQCALPQFERHPSVTGKWTVKVLCQFCRETGAWIIAGMPEHHYNRLATLPANL